MSDIISYTVNSDGSLTPIGCAGANACGLTGAGDVKLPVSAGGFTGLAITPDGERVYAVQESIDAIWMLDRTGSGANGALQLPDNSEPADYCVQDVAEKTEDDCATFARGMTELTGSIAVSPDLHGQNVYVVSDDDGVGVISEFQADLSGGTPVGALTQLNGTNGCISQSGNDDETGGETGAPLACATGYGLWDSSSAAISADGQNLYVVGGSENDGVIVGLAVNALTGVLSEDADSAGSEPDCYTDDGAGFGSVSPEDADCTTFQGMDGLSYWGDGYGSVALSAPGATTVSASGSELYAPAATDDGLVDLSRTPPPQYTVTGQASPAAGGTISASSDSAAASCTGAACTVYPNASVTLTPQAATGYRIKGLADRLRGRHRRLHGRGHRCEQELHRPVRPALHGRGDRQHDPERRARRDRRGERQARATIQSARRRAARSIRATR